MSSSKPGIQDSTAQELAYTRSTPPAHTDTPLPTIIFLHGLQSCRLEFSRVTPLLEKDYDVIAIDLPGHSDSKATCPTLTMDTSVNALSRLISTQVPSGKAHIVGLSMGGYISLEFARRHPEQVLSMFCTGSAPHGGIRKWLFQHPRLLSGFVVAVTNLATDRLFWSSVGGVKPIPGLRDELSRNNSPELLSSGFRELLNVTLESMAEIRGVRIAFVAGGKGDNVAETKEAGKVLREGNAECRTFVVREAIHWWSIQLPELFAQGVRAWIEAAEMPKDFEALD